MPTLSSRYTLEVGVPSPPTGVLKAAMQLKLRCKSKHAAHLQWNSNLTKALNGLSTVFPAIQLHGIGKARICNGLYWQVLDASNNLGHLNNVTRLLAVLYTVSRYKLLFGVRRETSLNVAVSWVGRPNFTIGTTRGRSAHRLAFPPLL
jgi:hypothetical protein